MNICLAAPANQHPRSAGLKVSATFSEHQKPAKTRSERNTQKGRDPATIIKSDFTLSEAMAALPDERKVDRKDEEQGPDLLVERAQRLKEMRLMERRHQNSVVRRLRACPVNVSFCLLSVLPCTGLDCLWIWTGQ
jgi:hypothetical protein